MATTSKDPAPDYIIIDEKSENSDFHIQYPDGNCICFQYSNDNDSVKVVPPHNPYSCWDSMKKPTGTLVIPQHVQRKNKRYMVTEIREWAFWDCDSLQSIVVPSSVTDIGAGCFNGCSGLQTIIVDEGNPDYDSRQQCNAIIETATNELIAGCKNTVIPHSVVRIANYAFYGCSDLDSIVIPPSVTEIGNVAFRHCSNLQSIVVPDAVSEIGIRAFEGCSSLRSIVIPNRVKEIADWTFKGCGSLQKVVIPDSIQKIGEEAFRDCTSIESIDIPSSVKELGHGVFRGCNSLQSIVIPDKVQEIGASTFEGCTSLCSIRIQDPKLLDGTGVDWDKVQITTY